MKKYISTVMAGLLVTVAVALPSSVAKAADTTGLIPVTRLYQPATGDHFYTTSASDIAIAESVGFQNDGVGFNAYATSASGVPVYRLYSPLTEKHFYTTSTSDVTIATGVGYQNDGVAFYEDSAASANNVAVDRMYQPRDYDHFYTTSASDVSIAKSVGYQDEGAVFYAPTSAVAPQTNLIANPSVETSTDGVNPDSFAYGSFGTISATSSYLNTGHTGTRSLGITVTSAAASAGAEWAPTPSAVTPNQLYQFSMWYQSSVDTEVDVAVTDTTGVTTYNYVGKVLASPGVWTQFTGQYMMPTNAASAQFYAVINTPGTLTTDDYSLEQVTATGSGFNTAMVSVDFDDGWGSQYTNALPIVQADNIPTTMYIISGANTDDPDDYMTNAQIQAFQNASDEIGSHTVTHPDLTTLPVGNNTTPNTVDYELFDSKTTLQADFGSQAAIDFASPDGAYNATVLAEIKKYYSSHRSVDSGFNDKQNFDVFNIHVESVTSDTPPAQIEAWVDEAIATKTWLVLVYHEVVTTETVGPGGPVGGDIYHTEKTDLQAEMDYINAHRSQITPMTTRQAITAIQAQL
jgi:peptidoglycan/xylan/chitin deacetylase (PgdA/CDA1 family)